MKIRIGTAICVLSYFLLSSALAQEIGLFSDAECSNCGLEIAPGETRTVFVSGPIEPSAFGVLGAGEFRIIGIPDGWIHSDVTPGPNVLLFFDFFESGGAFAIVSGASATCNAVFSFSLTATTSQSNIELGFAAKEPPSSPIYPCPSITFVDGPGMATDCLVGGKLLINSSQPCTVPISRNSWGVIKQLYR